MPENPALFSPRAPRPLALEPAVLVQQVRRTLTRRIAHGESISVTHVATELGMSRRALQRGLQAGCRFQQLAADVLGEHALLLLRSRPDLSVKEVAARLGFSSTRAFTRACKRWFAEVPSDLRCS